MEAQTLVTKYLPQNPDIEVLVPNYKEPILPVNHGGFGWYGLMAYNEHGQLMCHECGVYWDSLAGHIRKHKLTNGEYRGKYGLLNNTALTSETLRLKYQLIMLNDSKRLEQNRVNFAKVRKLAYQSTRGRKSRQVLELQNRHDTCPTQVLRWLYNAAEIYGANINELKTETYRPGLVNLIRKRFGSFNKAKQLLRLINNNQGGNKKYPKELILEDMCCFYSQYGRWAGRNDYIAGKMMCCASLLHLHGGLTALRQEAMKLREEQEERRIKGEQIVKIANNIEMESAGRARR